MSTIAARGLLAVLGLLLPALLPLPAAAAPQLHQICYRDSTIANEPTAVSVDCRSDTPGISCKAVPPPGFVVLSQGSTPTTFGASYRAPSAKATYHMTFKFSGGTVRGCTVEMDAPPTFADQGRLVGYTTDDSGLLMTGVWASTRMVPPATGFADSIVSVPTDFLVTGGGATGTEFPHGALLSDIARSELNSWEGGTQQIQSFDAYAHQSFAIGMKIEGMTNGDLLAASSQTSGLAPDQVIPAVAPAVNGSLILGGGATVFPGPPWGQFLFESAPVLAGGVITGWEARSKAHVVPNVSDLAAFAYLFKIKVTAGGQDYRLEVTVNTGAAGPAQHPDVVVQGTRGFALTGVGALVDWEDFGAFGNLLWEIQPRPDVGGVEAASKDHTFVSPAVIEGFAIGARLVP